jgi:hypothetical protein
MPPHERLRLNNCDNLQNRWKPSIQLDQEPAVVVCKPDPARHFSPQNYQLMSKCCILSLKRPVKGWDLAKSGIVDPMAGTPLGLS